MRDHRYDVLFEPVRIGPVTARNRFFQVPHCNGMGHRHPSSLAEMRGVKAEGGWAVVCTEEVEIHHTSALDGAVEGRLWDDMDIPAHRLTVERVHAHGGLAGIELVHSGLNAPNTYSRVPALGPAVRPVTSGTPSVGREMTLADIADLREWHRAAVRRSLRAGYDVVYVYAAHGLTVFQQFLSPRFNSRTDEYGGSLENRVRLLREVLEDTLELCAGRAAVACRIVVDELLGVDGQGRAVGLGRSEMEEVFGLIGELPDLWDLMVGEWDFDSSTSRFEQEGYSEPFVHGFKQLTTKPVVIVGRYTSPDTMVRLVNQGITDFIGAARPSIADPFLPNKIAEGRVEDIRECIGCNICVSGDWLSVPIRCTQNASMGEEWRRGWHPERIAPKPADADDAKVLIIGAGPAGLEAAMWLGRRGYEVVLTEASRTLGGRVVREAALPGLAEWGRVRDHRVLQLEKLDNVLVTLESPMTAEEIVEYDFTHVAVATGATWRVDGLGRFHAAGVFTGALTPDDLLAGVRPSGNRVVVYDDELFYIGGVLAELLATEGFRVTIVTPESKVSAWTVNTMEQHKIHRRLVAAGVTILTDTTVLGHEGNVARLACTYTGREHSLASDAIVSITFREPHAPLVGQLQSLGSQHVQAIGDAYNPGTIAEAVYSGRLYAEALQAPDLGVGATPFRREIIGLAGR
ncbi:MAG: FAD-dependent oxidoreductase [Ilumatobacteraceae bacterium]|nr:FAD-dependent oxidoreductase [Ilumatobacteraceae bacterium]